MRMVDGKLYLSAWTYDELDTEDREFIDRVIKIFHFEPLSECIQINLPEMTDEQLEHLRECFANPNMVGELKVANGVIDDCSKYAPLTLDENAHLHRDPPMLVALNAMQDVAEQTAELILADDEEDVFEAETRLQAECTLTSALAAIENICDQVAHAAGMVVMSVDSSGVATVTSLLEQYGYRD